VKRQKKSKIGNRTRGGIMKLTKPNSRKRKIEEKKNTNNRKTEETKNTKNSHHLITLDDVKNELTQSFTVYPNVLEFLKNKIQIPLPLVEIVLCYASIGGLESCLYRIDLNSLLGFWERDSKDESKKNYYHRVCKTYLVDNVIEDGSEMTYLTDKTGLARWIIPVEENSKRPSIHKMFLKITALHGSQMGGLSMYRDSTTESGYGDMYEALVEYKKEIK
jgi:hypothetical protein